MSHLFNLTFLFHITPLIIKAEAPENRRFNGYWHPPDSKDDFVLDTANQTGWWKWATDSPVEPSPSLNPSLCPSTSSSRSSSSNDEKLCSIFFDSECGYFLITPTDCASTGSTDSSWDIGWTRIRINGLVVNPSTTTPTAAITTSPCKISKLTFFAERLTLAGTGSESWMPQYLPETYNNLESQTPTALVGDLALLVAIAAFTCEPRRNDIISTMNNHFRLPRWIPRPGGRPFVSKFSLYLPS